MIIAEYYDDDDEPESVNVCMCVFTNSCFCFVFWPLSTEVGIGHLDLVDQTTVSITKRKTENEINKMNDRR